MIGEKVYGASTLWPIATVTRKQGETLTVEARNGDRYCLELSEIEGSTGDVRLTIPVPELFCESRKIS
jgi:hypothetical protein